MSLLSSSVCDSPPIHMKWHTMFWNCTPVEVYYKILHSMKKFLSKVTKILSKIKTPAFLRFPDTFAFAVRLPDSEFLRARVADHLQVSFARLCTISVIARHLHVTEQHPLNLSRHRCVCQLRVVVTIHFFHYTNTNRILPRCARLNFYFSNLPRWATNYQLFFW